MMTIRWSSQIKGVVVQAISDKIRHYRKTFRPPVFYAMGSLVLWLSLVLVALILSLVLSDLYIRLAGNAFLLSSHSQFSLLLAEVPALLGLGQAYYIGRARRYRLYNPNVVSFGFRRSFSNLTNEKTAYLKKIFRIEDDLMRLAAELVDEWEWREKIKLRCKETWLIRASGFFRLPSASNFAAYVTGILAVVAGIVIATMTPDAVFGSINEYVDTALAMAELFWLVIIIAVCVLPCAVILGSLKSVGDVLLESINDQYLSNTAFYRFIAEVLELHDLGDRLLLRKTVGWAYWSVRVLVSPIHELPKIRRGIRRAKRLHRPR
jgi:hypothetical protein